MSNATFDPALLAMPTDENIKVEADYFEGAPIPQETADPLTLRFSAGTKGVQVKTDDSTGKPYVYVNYSATVTEGPQEGCRFFGIMNSKPSKRGASEVHTFISKCGYGGSLRPGQPVGEILDLLTACLNEGHDIPGCLIRWTAQFVPKAVDPATGQEKSDWKNARTIASRMDQFPQDAEGNYIPEIKDPVTNTILNAEVKLRKLG